MKLVLRLTLALPLMAISFLTLGEDQAFPGIQKLMTKDEYTATGLHKLTAAERTALDQWLIGYTIGEGPVIRRTNEEVKEAEKAIQIVSHIKPPFTGWTGETIFYLENGQVWRQRLTGRYHHMGDSTEVIISKNFLGFYKMTLEEGKKSVGVSRVR